MKQLLFALFIFFLFLFTSLSNANKNKEINFEAYEYLPRNPHVAFTGHPNEMSIIFFTDVNSTDYKIKYSTINFGDKNNLLDSNNKKLILEETKYFKYFNYQANGMFRPLYIHEFLLKNLPSKKTKIYYQILFTKDESIKTEIHSFKTMLATNEDLPTSSNNDNKPIDLSKIKKTFQFISYGDMDVHRDGQDTIDNILEYHLKDSDFIIHQGDIPYAWQEDKWDIWFNLIEKIIANTPYMVCVGNHEEINGFISYKNRFTNNTKPYYLNDFIKDKKKEDNNSDIKQETNNLYYSFNYGSIHFIALSSEHDYNLQKEWLERDLTNVNREETPFIIVFTHRPMYSSNKNHGSHDPLRIAIEPLFKKYKIDLALFGHVHAYERTCPIIENGECDDGNDVNLKHFNYFKNPKGTIHIHAGTAGFELNPEWDAPAPNWSVFRKTVHGLLRVKVYGKSALTVEFIEHGNKVVDQFMIHKTSEEDE
ncbi:hypothetical protein ABK040_000392 [Willaertia magna]